MANLLKGLEEKGVDSGVDAAESGAKSAASAALDVAKDESRKVALKISNKTNEKWKNPRIFLDCGVPEDLLPLEVDADSELSFEVHKKKWTMSGIEGVITYEWVADNKTYTLAVLFRSPTVSSNCWNAVIYVDESVRASQQLFRTLSREGALKADNNYSDKVFNDLTLQAAMTTSGTAKLSISVTKN